MRKGLRLIFTTTVFLDKVKLGKPKCREVESDSLAFETDVNDLGT